MVRKRVVGIFEARELTCSLFSYTLTGFEKLKASEISQQWYEDLYENSSSYPVYEGSPFGKGGLGLKVSIDDSPDSKILYVVPHYFYASAEYLIEGPIDDTYEIKLAPIVGKLMQEGPMHFAVRDGEQLYFEMQRATDGSAFTVNFYWGRKLVGSLPLSDLDDEVLAQIAKDCLSKG